jgi:hypothetical protein
MFPEIKIEEQVITSPVEMAETFNNYFLEVSVITLQLVYPSLTQNFILTPQIKRPA